jgi:hypothetical protein
MTVTTPHFEPLRTMRQAAEMLALPSVDALRMFLTRRPGLVGDRRRRRGRSDERLLTTGEIEQIAVLMTSLSRANPPER